MSFFFVCFLMISESQRKLMGFGYGGDEMNYHAGCVFFSPGL